MAEFRQSFSKAQSIVIITGAGVSAESGVPTFRGAGGYWRKWQAQVINLILVTVSISTLISLFLTGEYELKRMREGLCMKVCWKLK